MALKSMEDIVNMDGGAAIDWIIENQHEYVLAKIDDEISFLKEMKDNLKKYRNGNCIVSLDHLQQMIEDGIHDYESYK